MDAQPDLGRIARTIGDPTRIRMLTLLMDGRALTAKELAHGTQVGPATATVHLRRLRFDGLVTSTVQGRHKYFRLASSRVAECIESLLVVAMPGTTDSVVKREPIHEARFCYDHLAGRLGIAITDALTRRKYICASGKDFAVSKRGERWFAATGIDVAAAAQTRRRFACACLDWSERRDHVGGALGAAIAQRMLDAGWLRRKPDSRVVTVTSRGAAALQAQLGLRWP